MEYLATTIGYAVLFFLGIYLFQYLTRNPYSILLIITGLKCVNIFCTIFYSKNNVKKTNIDYKTSHRHTCPKTFVHKDFSDESSTSSSFYMENVEFSKEDTKLQRESETSTVIVNDTNTNTSNSQSISDSSK